ncbi:hypothetical protein [Streptosporangium carneum]|uniref:Uncharacterized protein n=1 Tax=Streptosporangium carneum TaxID=47481 RepID=A0A9W6MH97_9ACTN|nr:hypothetical protein [Streptosporangium carneum]GLK13798.1 hypothetical protein GCM10017600_72090 [Streptosporangium carneum]
MRAPYGGRFERCKSFIADRGRTLFLESGPAESGLPQERPSGETVFGGDGRRWLLLVPVRQPPPVSPADRRVPASPEAVNGDCLPGVPPYDPD